MKKSRAETAETRRRILAAAAEEFRRNGLHDTCLNEVMSAAGMTQGGFYRHFKSKDQLIAEACAAGMAVSADAFADAACACPEKVGIEGIVDAYLSIENPEEPGCPFVTLGSELARADEATREVATDGFRNLVDVVAKRYPNTKPELARERAEFVVCALIGALTVSRVVTDPDLAQSILESARKRLVKV